MRSSRLFSLSATVALALAASLPAQAASSAASSASDSVSTSVGASSTSIQKSSDGSSKATGIAAGEYRVIDVAALDAAAGRPALLQVRLQAVADGSADGAFTLLLPPQAVAQAPLAAGQVVSARSRAYGTEFARGDAAFFLVLHDAWYQDLANRPVTL